jgi:hypothetical protein
LENEVEQRGQAVEQFDAAHVDGSHIGIHGFRSFGFVTGSGDNIYAVDTDLARIDWQKNFAGKASADASLTCPGGMTTGATHALSAAFSAPMQGGRGGGRATGAKSGVGEPGKGGITVAELEARAAAAAAAGPNAGRAADLGGRWTRAQSVVVNSLSSDGCSTRISSPTATSRARIPFLPGKNANAKA